MKNSKKSVVGHADFLTQLNGENKKVSNDLNVRIAGYYLLQITLTDQSLISRFGLRNG